MTGSLFLLSDLLPVDPPEELVVLDILNLEPQVGVNDQYVLHNIPSQVTQVLRQLDRVSPNLFQYILRTIPLLLIPERCEPANHLANEYPETPDIRLIVVPMPHHDLRRRIPGRSTVRKCPVLVYVLELLGKPEVYQLHMPLLVYQYILRLQVSVKYIHF